MKAISPRSELLRVAALLLLSAGALGAQITPAPDPVARPGTAGLTVLEHDGLVDVRWGTAAPSAGLLEVVFDDSVVHRVRTDVARSHAASFRHPHADALTLRFGASDGPLHEALVSFAEPERPDVLVAAPDSLFILGDTHGEYDRVVTLLRNAGLIDAEHDWSGGSAHLVFLGDLTDRGGEVTRLLWFVYALERQAERAGGRVHVLLGNHEVLVMAGDERYVAPPELQNVAAQGLTYAEAFHPDRSVLGRWLASKPAVMRIGDVLLAHGGVGPEYADWRPRAIADTLARYVAEPLFRRWADSTVVVQPMDSAAFERRFSFFFGDDNPFWYRGYVQADTLSAPLERALDRADAQVHVVAHTAVPTIAERYGGRLIAVQPREPALEMLLLVKSPDGWKRELHRLAGPPVPLATGR